MVPPIDAALTAQFPANSLPYREFTGKKRIPSRARGEKRHFYQLLMPFLGRHFAAR
jgi:hypothetical protein